MPSRPQRTIVQIDHPHLGKDVEDKNRSSYIQHGITPAEYINYITGTYGERPYWINNHMPADHPHSTERNNDKALERLRQHLAHQKGGHPDNELDGGDAEQHAQNIIRTRPISPEMINHVIEEPKAYGLNKDERIRHLSPQPNLNKSHLMKIATNPDLKFGSLVEHPQMDKEVADALMSDPRRVGKLGSSQIRTMLSSINHEDPNKRLIDEKGVVNLLENNHVGIKDPEDFDNLIQHVQPSIDQAGQPDHSKRKEIMDNLLGINGGSYTNEADNYDNPDHFHYNNWDTGVNYNPRKAAAIAGSKYLTPDQIDHIKRHGDFDEKYALFNNKHIDPKHSGEMYNNWINDDTDKGYDLDELKERIKEDNPYEDSYDDYYEEAREAEQEDNPFSDYVKENVDDSDLMDGRDEEEWIDDYLENGADHDWSVPNPKHKDDPENEDPLIDYGGRDKSDHPDYQARYDDASKKYDEELEARRRNPEDALSQRQRDRLYDGYDEYLSEGISDRAQQLYYDKMDSAHEDKDFLPSHLPHLEEMERQRREAAEIEARRKADEKAAEDKPELDKFVPQRATSHPYGDLQHHVQMAQGYANANGGKVDIGTLKKLHPNLKDKFNEIFFGKEYPALAKRRDNLKAGIKDKNTPDDEKEEMKTTLSLVNSDLANMEKGKTVMSSEGLQQKLDSIPKTPYAISHQIWDADNTQNLNSRNEVVFRLDHTPESLEAIKADPEVHRVFNKIAEVSKRSGHPTNPNTIAWSRVDANDPKHWMIDEVQSDFGSAARDYLDDNGKKEEADAVNKVIAIHKNWREALINHIINEAKKHGAERVSTHSPESKAAHTGSDTVHTVYQDSYQKVPRSMGFKPAPMEALPLNEEGKKDFMRGRSGVPVEDLKQMLVDGLKQHAYLSAAHNNIAENPIGEENDLTDSHKKLADHHLNMYNQHLKKLLQLDPTDRNKNSKTPEQYIKVNPLDDELKGRAAFTQEANSNANALSNKLSKPPVYGFDSALWQKPQRAGHEGHTYDLNPATVKKSLNEVEDLLKMEKMDSQVKQKIAATLHLLQSNEDILDQIHQSNPQAYVAIKELVESMVQMAKKTTGKDPATDVHKLEIQNELDAHQNPDEQQPQDGGEEEGAQSGGGGGHLPHTDKPLQQKQLVFGPGAVRRYNAQDARVKDTSGKWHSQTGKAKEAQDGSNG